MCLCVCQEIYVSLQQSNLREMKADTCHNSLTITPPRKIADSFPFLFFSNLHSASAGAWWKYTI